jgi:hypothetical protein
MNDVRWPRSSTPTGRFAIPINCRCSMCEPRILTPRKCLIIAAAIVGCLALSLSGCATVKTCDKPLSGQALSDGAAVLLCTATQGKTLAQCEEAQLAIEAGQLGQDILVCAELAVASTASQPHATAVDAGK